jgi:hypothetical protein
MQTLTMCAINASVIDVSGSTRNESLSGSSFLVVSRALARLRPRSGLMYWFNGALPIVSSGQELHRVVNMYPTVVHVAIAFTQFRSCVRISPLAISPLSSGQ